MGDQQRPGELGGEAVYALVAGPAPAGAEARLVGVFILLLGVVMDDGGAWDEGEGIELRHCSG